MKQAILAVTLALTCVLWIGGCGETEQTVISDPVGSSTFFVQSQLGVPIEVEVVYARGAGGGQLSAVIPASQRLDLGTKTALAPPYPHQVFVSIRARRSDWLASQVVVVYEAGTAAEDERLWQKTVRQAEYPPQYEYTLTLDDTAFGR